MCDDVTQLEVLDHASLTAALRQRYAANAIYTYVGDILITLNPFKPVALYTPEMHQRYTHDLLRQQPPHIFAVADRAFHAMLQNAEPQVCIISGESGAGKTEAAKLLLQHLVHLAQLPAAEIFADKPGHDRPLSVAAAEATASHHSNVHKRILQTTPVLEAFGNTETTMNANSSRFGKYLELQFTVEGRLIGASLRHYLLEKSRVVRQPDRESNYHVFRYFTAGIDPETRRRLRLPDNLADTRYLGPHCRTSTEADPQAWQRLLQSVRDVGFSEANIESLTRILACICLLGQVDFEEDAGDGSRLTNLPILQLAAELLGLDAEALLTALTTTKTQVRQETFVKPNPLQKTYDTLDAAAKALYERCFAWLVATMDSMLWAPQGATPQYCIGILDIFGFENMRVNGFEQLCINLANERLQLYFNHNIFEMELRDYASEGLDLLNLEFSSNIHTLDLILRRPIGILALLNEECRFAASTDDGLVSKLKTSLNEHDAFICSPADDSFGIKHYAGAITYSAHGFLERNRDPLPAAIADVFSASKELFATRLFAENFLLPRHSWTNMEVPRKRSRPSLTLISNKTSQQMRSTTSIIASWQGDTATTVSGQFHRSLERMIQRMETCQPQFVRCIRPNMDQLPNAFDDVCVVRQLRDTGVMEATRIRKEGYSHRIPFAAFVQRYSHLAFSPSATVHDNAAACRAILARAERDLGKDAVSGRTPPLAGWQVGKSKVFLKFWHLDALAVLVQRHNNAAVKLQAAMTGIACRCRLRKVMELARTRKAEMVTFMSELHTRAFKTATAQEHLRDHDVAMANAGQTVTDAEGGWFKRRRRESSRNKAKINPAAHFKSMKKLEKSVETWWLKSERSKGVHCDDRDMPFSWFHGCLDHAQADELLEEMAPGYFLVRVCQVFHGYALSYRSRNRVHHHRVFCTPGGRYQVQGLKEDFESLAQLVEYYGVVAIEDGGVLLRGHVTCAHSYNLGSLDADVAACNGVDMVARNGRIAREQQSGKQGGNNRRARAGSVVSLKYLPEDEAGPPMPSEIYLQPGERPWWLRGTISRNQAEAELSNKGEGQFLVREKIVGPNRVVFALTYKSAHGMRHHLLERPREGCWKLDEIDLATSGTLNDLIHSFQEERHPDLGSVLAPDPPPLPPLSGPRKSPSHRRPSASKNAVSPARFQLTLPPTPNILKPDGSVDLWPVDAVVQWLNAQQLHRYAGGFRRQAIDGHALLQLSRPQLRALVNNSRDRARLSKAITALKQADASSPMAASNSPFRPVGRPSRVFLFPDVPPMPTASSRDSMVPRSAPHSFYNRRRKWLRLRPEERLKKLAKRGDLDGIKRLLRQQPSLDVDGVRRGGDCKTALYLASEGGHLSVVQLLLDEGANPYKRSNGGLTAVQAALVHNHSAVVTALQEADDGTISQYSTGTIDRRMPALPVVSPALNVSPSRPPASAPRRPSMSLVLDTDVSKPPLPSRPSTLLPTPLSPPVPPRVHGQATPPGARSPLNTSPALSRKPVNITVQDVPSKKPSRPVSYVQPVTPMVDVTYGFAELPLGSKMEQQQQVIAAASWEELAAIDQDVDTTVAPQVPPRTPKKPDTDSGHASVSDTAPSLGDSDGPEPVYDGRDPAALVV